MVVSEMQSSFKAGFSALNFLGSSQMGKCEANLVKFGLQT